MKNAIPITVLFAAICALPIAALANPHDDNNRRPEAPRQAAPVRQQAPSFRPQPQQYRQQQPQQYRQQQPQQYRQQQPVYRQQQPVYRQQPVQPRNVQQMPRYQGRTVTNVTYVSHSDRRAWDWNRGNVWYSRPNYWGGGFWGAFSLGIAFNSNNYNAVPYYAVQQSSPGAQLLQQYGLTQTTCDQPNLVDITGPDGGEICAYPNDEVSPGQYNVDPSTLTLISN